MKDTLTVSEIFGPTFQGEGKYAGRRCAFLRLGACNLNCSWCDTSYTWDWTGQNGIAYEPRKELRSMTLDEVAGSLEELHCKHIVVSGGEPMLQQEALYYLFHTFDSPHDIEIETNGTILPQQRVVDYVKHFDVSPKLSNSGIPLQKRFNLPALRAYASTAKASFKFVVTSVDDLTQVDHIVGEIYGPVCPVENIWIMPEGRSGVEILEGAAALADEVLARGYNMTLRMQTLLWGSARAR